MSFSEAVQTLPDAVRLWVLWLTLCMVAAPLTMLAWRKTRVTGAVTLGVNAAVAGAMHVAHAEFGMVRLLGAVHLVFWGPLAVWLAMQLRRPDLPRVPAVAALVFLASVAVSLVFDAVDVARYAMGERAPLTPAAG